MKTLLAENSKRDLLISAVALSAKYLKLLPSVPSPTAGETRRFVERQVRLFRASGVGWADAQILVAAANSGSLIFFVGPRCPAGVDEATAVRDLKAPPGNKLEKLSGDLDGKFSIRINQQFRIVFAFARGNATEVQIVDCH
jgi:hypothetical protein